MQWPAALPDNVRLREPEDDAQYEALMGQLAMAEVTTARLGTALADAERKYKLLQSEYNRAKQEEAALKATLKKLDAAFKAGRISPGTVGGGGKVGDFAEEQLRKKLAALKKKKTELMGDESKDSELDYVEEQISEIEAKLAKLGKRSPTTAQPGSSEDSARTAEIQRIENKIVQLKQEHERWNFSYRKLKDKYQTEEKEAELDYLEERNDKEKKEYETAIAQYQKKLASLRK